ncbi:DUF3291 domain-containing protein [Methylobacterium dankookense]|uniref:DUF3291 domain-containing protein n=1 Tax=Methylobacterium dankookense TaxID=560405 RepID=A0A564FYM1_9HYPH|nr:DUF3291 domain-containing protein [Methylobacterium dankookense]GJD57345.1 hypothetical protein IFDJLNFL_3246 [Methylobacterium dankookense]VUF13253.1 hypothetical protein MTDSW087_02953 [Methylobacterium dankookense]
MPFISVTRLRIRSIRFLPAFALHAVRTARQVRGAPGYRGGAILRDRDWTFWTLTAWDRIESMRGYMGAGAHRAAMPHLQHWCDEASVVHWDRDEAGLPAWPEADKRMRDSGRTSRVRHPSPRHDTLSYRPPRFGGTSALPPAAAAKS